MNNRTTYLLVTTATFFWGANFVLGGVVIADLPPLWAAALRFLLGAAVMLMIAFWRGDALLEPLRRHAAVYALLGLVGISGFNLLFFFALKSTSATNAALIMATNPLLTTLVAAILLKERPTTRQLAALPLALLGVVVVISGGSLARLEGLQLALGDLLMLAANVMWALFNVLSRRYLPAGSAVANTTLVMCAGALLLLAAAVVDGGSFTFPGDKAAAALLTMAIGGTVLAYLFWNMGIRALGAARTSLFLNLVPVFAMVIEAFDGNQPTLVQLLGGLLVTVGVSIAMLPRRIPAVG